MMNNDVLMSEMKNKAKTFAIYCSQGASRIIKFYSNRNNAAKFKPTLVVYDGATIDIIDSLRKYFGDALLVFDKEKLNSGSIGVHTATSEFIRNAMKEKGIDYLLCFGDKILKKKIIAEYPNRLINFHPSILPAFKGLYAIDQALQYNASLIGNTAHFIDEGIDTGKIIVQTAMLKSDFDSYEDVLELQFPMMKLIFRDLLNYDVSDEEISAEVANRTKAFMIPRDCN